MPEKTVFAKIVIIIASPCGHQERQGSQNERPVGKWHQKVFQILEKSCCNVRYRNQAETNNPHSLIFNFERAHFQLVLIGKIN